MAITPGKMANGHAIGSGSAEVTVNVTFSTGNLPSSGNTLTVVLWGWAVSAVTGLTVTDDQTGSPNTYNPDLAVHQEAAGNARFYARYRCGNITVNKTSLTISAQSVSPAPHNVSNLVAAALETAGESTSSPQDGADVAKTGNSTNPTSNTYTPSVNGDIIIALLVDDIVSGGATPTPSGYALVYTETDGTNYEVGGFAYQIQTTATATAPGWTEAGSGTWSTDVAGYKAIPATPSPSPSAAPSSRGVSSTPSSPGAASSALSSPGAAALSSRVASSPSSPGSSLPSSRGVSSPSSGGASSAPGSSASSPFLASSVLVSSGLPSSLGGIPSSALPSSARQSSPVLPSSPGLPSSARLSSQVLVSSGLSSGVSGVSSGLPLSSRVSSAAPSRAPCPLHTYYADVVNGSDSTGTGTFGSPWKTMGKGISQMVAGDTLYLRAGTYPEYSDDSTSHNQLPTGTATCPTVIAGYPGETVLIQPPAATGRGFHIQNGQKYVTLQDFILDGTNATGGTAGNRDGIKFDYGTSPSYFTLLRLEVRNFPDNGILIGQDIATGNNAGHNTIQGCLVHDNGGVNTLRHGIYIESSDNLITQNQLYNNGGYGIQMYASAADGTAANTDYCARNVFTRNIMYGNGVGGVTLWSGQGNLLANNLAYNNGGAGVQVDEGADATLVLNNTFYHNALDGSNNWGGIDLGNNAIVTAPVTNTVVKNNIATNTVGTAGDYKIHGTFVTGTVSDYNLTLDGTAVGANSKKNTNPRYVNAAGADFRLQPGSPAVDAGTDLSASITDDLNGTPRPQGAAWDMGAYEGTVASPSPSSPRLSPGPSPFVSSGRSSLGISSALSSVAGAASSPFLSSAAVASPAVSLSSPAVSSSPSSPSSRSSSVVVSLSSGVAIPLSSGASSVFVSSAVASPTLSSPSSGISSPGLASVVVSSRASSQFPGTSSASVSSALASPVPSRSSGASSLRLLSLLASPSAPSSPLPSSRRPSSRAPSPFGSSALVSASSTGLPLSLASRVLSRASVGPSPSPSLVARSSASPAPVSPVPFVGLVVLDTMNFDRVVRDVLRFTYPILDPVDF